MLMRHCAKSWWIQGDNWQIRRTKKRNITTVTRNYGNVLSKSRLKEESREEHWKNRIKK